jgi:hypothetical protein
MIKPDIAVVKKTFRYSNGFFYNRLYRNSLFRNFIMESGISINNMDTLRNNPTLTNGNWRCMVEITLRDDQLHLMRR